MSTYTATIRWSREGAEGFTKGQYSRAHEWAFDGGHVMPASASPHVVPAPWSDPAGVDPEEAFVASLSSCHMLFFLDFARRGGWTIDETVTFALDGISYEIDLTTDNAAKLRDAFGPWVGHARKVGGRSSSRAVASPRSRSSRGDAQAIRDWAKAHGHKVSERGRISAEVKAAYEAAH